MNETSSLLAATTTGHSAAERFWDVLVVGAGPAGALAARQIAAGGCSVLLIDKSAFPRWKVCGCCLNGSALAALQHVGLGDLPSRRGAVALSRWQLSTRRGAASLPLRSGAALSRQALDAALIEEAIRAGAEFLPETRAQVEQVERDSRWVRVQRCEATRPPVEHGRTDEVEQPDEHGRTDERKRSDAHERFEAYCSIRARLVVCADGLSGGALRGQAGLASHGSRTAHMGAGVVLDDVTSDYPAGVIFMACARPGYVGLVRLEDGRLDIAAALRVASARECGGPGPLAAEVLAVAGLPIPVGLARSAWKGTAPLTRRPERVAAERLVLVGDAAGYVEPFTGEGIAWALWSAVAVTPLVLRFLKAGDRSPMDPWQRWHARSIGRRHGVCRMMSAALRRPLLVNLLSGVVQYAPWLAGPVLHGFDSPPSPLPV